MQLLTMTRGVPPAEECGVCREIVQPGTHVYLLPCTHWFCEECMDIWLNNSKTCPMCRRLVAADVLVHHGDIDVLGFPCGILSGGTKSRL